MDEQVTSISIPRRWLDLPMAAEYACVRTRTIRELIWSGQLRRSKIGKKFVIDVHELDRLLEGRAEREIDPEKPSRISGQERARRLKDLYPSEAKAVRGAKGG